MTSAGNCLPLRRVAESWMSMERETLVLSDIGPFRIGCTDVSAVEKIVAAILFRSRIWVSRVVSLMLPPALNSQNSKMQLLYYETQM